MTNYLFAIDPGKASGYAIFGWDKIEDVELLVHDELQSDELSDMLEVHLDFYMDKRSRVSNVAVVFEEFKITTQTGKNSDAPWSLENIGVIKYLCRKNNVPWTKQSPAAAKSFAPNERLKALGFWHVGGGGHALDAIRHGVLYLVKEAQFRSSDLLI